MAWSPNRGCSVDCISNSKSTDPTRNTRGPSLETKQMQIDFHLVDLGLTCFHWSRSHGNCTCLAVCYRKAWVLHSSPFKKVESLNHKSVEDASLEGKQWCHAITLNELCGLPSQFSKHSWYSFSGSGRGNEEQQGLCLWRIRKCWERNINK